MPQIKLISIFVVLAVGWGMALKAGRSARVDMVPGRDNKTKEVSYLGLGDSYTIGESVGPEERYPEQVRRLLTEEDHLDCRDPEIIAVTGWTTGNLLEALADAKPGGGDAGGQRGSAYDAVSLLIGVNNQYQGRSQVEYREQFEQLLQQCIRLAGNRPSHVLVLSIPDYSVTPFARMRGLDPALIAAQIDSLNRINYELARAYQVSYINVTAESRKAATDPSLIATDGLHFSGKEYGAWSRLMEPVLSGILKAGH
jgi:lysophospholipase L1-like esterase